MTRIDPDQMRQAKEWAKRIIAGNLFANEGELTTARYIMNLPDHIIDADRVRELADRHGDLIVDFMQQLDVEMAPETWENIRDFMNSLNSEVGLLPTPKPKTLADLIEEGHDPAQYQWMQAEHRDERCIISRMNGHVSQLTVSLLTATGATIWASTDEVIPLPDKPRLVWPASEQEPAEETPTPEAAPRVLVTKEDYESAPYGTICAEDGHFPLYTITWTWYTIGGDSHDHSAVAGTPRRVLRWGMGEQA